jgi:hypothetical protein
MAKPKKADIIIEIAGGTAEVVRIPKGLTLEIRDYDIDNGDSEPECRDDCIQDKNGDWYQTMFWG